MDDTTITVVSLTLPRREYFVSREKSGMEGCYNVTPDKGCVFVKPLYKFGIVTRK